MLGTMFELDGLTDKFKCHPKCNCKSLKLNHLMIYCYSVKLIVNNALWMALQHFSKCCGLEADLQKSQIFPADSRY